MKTTLHPRLLTPKQAASYMGRSVDWFKSHLPVFLPAQIRWDAKSDPMYDVRRLDQIIEERFKEASHA